jgi:effector-binding domain-containing protein
MKTLRNILIIVGALVALLLLIAAFLPKEYQLEKEVLVDASPAQVYPFVQTFEKRGEWYPWYRRDPNMERSLEGPDGEVGTISNWKGDPETVGSGSQKLVRLEENRRVETEISFTEPFESQARSYVDLEGEGGKTRVAWGFESRFPFPMNALIAVMGLESAVGKDYEEGLAKLKEVVETHVKKYGGYVIQSEQLHEQHYLAIRDQVGFAEMEAFQQKKMADLMRFINAENVQLVGPYSHLYYDWNEQEEMADMAIAMPVKSAPEAMPEAFSLITLPAGKYLYIDHVGDYNSLKDPHENMVKYLEDKNLESQVPAREEYRIGPREEPNPQNWVTRVYYPVSH